MLDRLKVNNQISDKRQINSLETLVTKKVSVVLCPNMMEMFDTVGRIRQKAHDLFMQYGFA
jgi:hypothetical protein